MRLPPLHGEIGPARYGIAAPALLLLQNAAVALAYLLSGHQPPLDTEFWLLPLRRLALLPDLPSWVAAVVFALSLLVAWGLAALSFKRATRSGVGYVIAALTVVPGMQVAAVVVLALLPVRAPHYPPEPEVGTNVAHVIQGVLAGVAIIVFAVLVSAVSFGAYGWGLFVLTPFVVGVTTAYLANRRAALEPGMTLPLVTGAAALGSLALVMFAIEGLVCIVLAAPLGLLAAMAGGALGRAAALAGLRRGKPFMSIALLPAVFAFEAAMPPALAITTDQATIISAPPSAVWRALTSANPIVASPGLVGRAGLAYPIGGQIIGEGVGAKRLGMFSTGNARERITEWRPGRRLAFAVLSQPPAMEEMSPYRHVHAPHVMAISKRPTQVSNLNRLPMAARALPRALLTSCASTPCFTGSRWRVGRSVRIPPACCKTSRERPKQPLKL